MSMQENGTLLHRIRLAMANAKQRRGIARARAKREWELACARAAVCGRFHR
jgi:hypothetical protein